MAKERCGPGRGPKKTPEEIAEITAKVENQLIENLAVINTVEFAVKVRLYEHLDQYSQSAVAVERRLIDTITPVLQQASSARILVEQRLRTSANNVVSSVRSETNRIEERVSDGQRMGTLTPREDSQASGDDIPDAADIAEFQRQSGTGGYPNPDRPTLAPPPTTVDYRAETERMQHETFEREARQRAADELRRLRSEEPTRRERASEGEQPIDLEEMLTWSWFPGQSNWRETAAQYTGMNALAMRNFPNMRSFMVSSEFGDPDSP